MPKSHTVHFLEGGKPVKADLPIVEQAGIGLVFAPAPVYGKPMGPMQEGSTAFSTEDMDKMVHDHLIEDTDKVTCLVTVFFEINGQQFPATASISRTNGGGAVWSPFVLLQ